MKAFKPAALIGQIAAAAIAAFDRSQQDSLVRLVLVLPLSPGFVAGLFFSGHGGNEPVAIISCWIVNTGLYWAVWNVLSFLRHNKSEIGRPSAPFDEKKMAAPRPG